MDDLLHLGDTDQPQRVGYPRARKLNMDTSDFYYTFSTIAQTLATGFGFLLAVVIYQIQGIVSGFAFKLQQAGYGGRQWGSDGENRVHEAQAKQDWDEVSRLLKGMALGQGWDGVRAKAYEESFNNDLQQLRKLKLWVRWSTVITFVTVGMSLVLIPCCSQIATIPTVGVLSVVSLVMFSVLSLASYFTLIMTVINPGKRDRSLRPDPGNQSGPDARSTSLAE